MYIYIYMYVDTHVNTDDYTLPTMNEKEIAFLNQTWLVEKSTKWAFKGEKPLNSTGNFPLPCLSQRATRVFQWLLLELK